MRLRSAGQRRRGAALLESAIVISVFLLIIVGLIDLSRALFLRHVLSQAAREAARRAAVHGSLAVSSWNGGSWGTSTYGPKAASSSDPQAQAVAPFLFGLDPSQVNIEYEWIDNSNAAESRVRVTLTTTWSPMLLSLPSTTYTLSASSTMQIAH